MKQPSPDSSLSECIRILDMLVGFDTVSCRSNLELIDWTARVLIEAGATVRILRDGVEPKANLLATIGPAGDGGVLLAAHSDVVPATDANWMSDPFRLSRRGTRLYGRGACDMKGFIACMLLLVQTVKVNALRVPIHLALSYDEELGCLGVPGLTSQLGQDLPRPRIAIVGEPTSMQPVVAHRGYRSFLTTIEGSPAHASRPADGVSAIRLAGVFLQATERLAGELSEVSGSETEAGLPSSTLNVGQIDGGEGTNIVAAGCEIHWELRPSTGTDVEAILNRLVQIIEESTPSDLLPALPGARISTRQIAAEPVFFEPTGPAFRLVSDLTGIDQGQSALYGSEAGFYQKAGLSTVIIGPGDIMQAHKVDEYIETDQLAAGLAFLTKLGNRLCEKGLEGI